MGKLFGYNYTDTDTDTDIILGILHWSACTLLQNDFLKKSTIQNKCQLHEGRQQFIWLLILPLLF